MSRYVQVQNPKSKRWARIDTKTGQVIGSRQQPYQCPVRGVVGNIKDEAPNQDLIRNLEKALEWAREGRLRTAISVYGWDDDAWTHGWVIDRRTSRRRMIGELTMVHFDILTNQALEDGDTVLSAAFDCD